MRHENALDTIITLFFVAIFLIVIPNCGKDKVEFIEVTPERVVVPVPEGVTRICRIGEAGELTQMMHTKGNFSEFLQVCHNFKPCIIYSDGTYEIEDNKIIRGFAEVMARIKYGCTE